MGRVLYIAEIDGDTSFQHVTIEEFDETKGYITISTNVADNWGRTKSFKYCRGVLYEETEEYSRDDQRFKAIPYMGTINENVQKAKEDLDLLAVNSEGKKLLDFFENKRRLSVCATLETEEERKVKQENNRDNKFPPLNYCHEFNVVYQGLPVPLPIETPPFKDYLPSYIVLGHEIAHAMSYHLKTQDLRYWKEETMLDEIYATHVENKIRRSAGLPLRNYYNFLSERMFGDKHYSLYINKNEDYPSYPPKEILNPNEAFNYNTIQKDE